MLTSRQRMLKAIQRELPDHTPCCFMSNSVLRKQCYEDMYEVTRRELAMGFDSMLFIPYLPRAQRPDHPDLRGLPVQLGPEVRTREWRELLPNGDETLRKKYQTPAGVLSTQVRLSDDWPHGNHIPFIDDYQVPRAVKPLITKHEELAALQYLMRPPSAEVKSWFAQEAEKACAFRDKYDVLLAGGWGVGIDMMGWLCGLENVAIHAIERPQFMADLLEMIHVWNMERMKVILSTPVDLFIRRAWYEGCDFTPVPFYKKEILPRLKAEVDLAHEHGAKFGYICSSGTRPILDPLRETGIDVLIGIDPVQDRYLNIPLMREKLGDRMSFWGGVSGAVTVEMGSEEEVRASVQKALLDFGKQGFILSPVDNITVDSERMRKNVEIFKDEWMKNW